MNPRDALTGLVGWINHSASDCYEHICSSGEIINLVTDLDTIVAFSRVASHPGYNEAVTVSLELAPLLPDGNAGTWINAAAVAIPAPGGKVETTIRGHDLHPDPADAGSAVPPCFRLARASVAPDSPEGMFVGLTDIQGL